MNTNSAETTHITDAHFWMLVHSAFEGITAIVDKDDLSEEVCRNVELRMIAELFRWRMGNAELLDWMPSRCEKCSMLSQKAYSTDPGDEDVIIKRCQSCKHPVTVEMSDLQT